MSNDPDGRRLPRAEPVLAIDAAGDYVLDLTADSITGEFNSIGCPTCDRFILAEVVDRDGARQYVSVDTDRWWDGVSPAFIDPPPHERLDGDAGQVARAAWSTPPVHCGARTRAGWPCRRTVTTPGNRCHDHQHTAR